MGVRPRRRPGLDQCPRRTALYHRLLRQLRNRHQLAVHNDRSNRLRPLGPVFTLRERRRGDRAHVTCTPNSPAMILPVMGCPSSSTSRTNVGWTAGLGSEFGLTRNISVNSEVMYFDL